MSKYTLTSEDYETINTIQRITESINETYQKLLELDLQGRKAGEEYNRQIDYLKSSLKLEQNLYERIDTSTERLQAFIDYIKKENNVTYKPDFIDLLTNENIGNYERIIIKLSVKMTSRKDYITAVRIPEITKYTLSTKDYKEVCQKEEVDLLLQISLENDLLALFLTLAKTKIDKPHLDVEVKKELIRKIYRLSFFKENIERILINNNFNIPESALISNGFVEGFFKPLSKEIDEYRKKILINIAMNHINKIIMHYDHELLFLKIEFETLLCELISRSVLQLLDDDSIYSLNDSFHEFIESNNFLSMHPHETETIRLAISCFKSVKFDRQRVMKMTLKG